MPNQTKIVAKKEGQKTRLSLVDVHSGREVNTGLSAQGEAQTEKVVRQLKEGLERAGNQVSYREV